MKGARELTEIREITEAMSKPDGNGQVHVKRGGPKGIMPSTWTNRTLRLEYIGGDEEGEGTSVGYEM